jgi:hypothetical protein
MANSHSANTHKSAGNDRPHGEGMFERLKERLQDAFVRVRNTLGGK